MNQSELNRIAMSFIENKSLEVAKKVKGVLTEDLKEKMKEMPGLTVHHIHNVSLFEVLRLINCSFYSENSSKDDLKEYCEYAETFREKFLDIVESLKDFAPSGKSSSDATNDQ